MKFKEMRTLTLKNKSNIEEGLSRADYKKAQAIVNDPKTKGGNYTQAMKDLEKWKRGSTKDKKVLDMLRIAHEDVKEDHEECPKCKGSGCEHCDDKGYHDIGESFGPAYPGRDYEPVKSAFDRMDPTKFHLKSMGKPVVIHSLSDTGNGHIDLIYYYDGEYILMDGTHKEIRDFQNAGNEGTVMVKNDKLKKRGDLISFAKKDASDFSKILRITDKVRNFKKAFSDGTDTAPRSIGRVPFKDTPTESVKESITEGTWAVPDSKKKLQGIQAILKKPIAGLEKNARKLLVDLYSLFGDDGLYDDIEAFFDAPDKSKDLRNVIIYHLSDWGVEFKGYKLTKAPAAWVDNSGPGHRIDTDEAKDQKIQRTPLGRKNITQEASVKRGRGNIKKPKGRSVIFSHHKDMKEIRKEGFDIQEKLSPKEMEKRLAMIKKAVEKINKKNADQAKKDALKMMKDSGMFDEGIDEGKYTAYSDLLIMKARIIDKEGPKSNKIPAVDDAIRIAMKKLGVKEDNVNEEVLVFSVDVVKAIGQKNLEKLMKKHDAYWTDGSPTGSVKGDVLARISSPKPMGGPGSRLIKDINKALPANLKQKLKIK